MAKKTNRKTAKRKKGISSKWARILRNIPGYDPIATAGKCHFDERKAQDALDFFPRYLVHVKGDLAQKPFELEPWQSAIVANVFGWIRPDGTRRYREVLLYVARKNGKSTLIAGVALLILFTDGEWGAEIYSAAAERGQAALVFGIAKQMVLENPELDEHARCYINSIALEDMGSFYKPISADANTKHGFNVHAAVIDELHAQPNRELVDVLETGTAGRLQPLIFHVTTADFQRESICNEKHEYACRVRDGITDNEEFLPVIYEAERDEDWHDPKIWARCNPNFHVPPLADRIKSAHKKAEDSPSFENTFKRLHLCMKTEQDVRWLKMNKWDDCPQVATENSLQGQSCFAGLDLASTTDIAAFVGFFDELNALLCRFWVPEIGARERSRRDRMDYLKWIKMGLIKATPGDVIDYDIIRADINELNKLYNIREIAIDRWNSTQLQTQLMGDGFEVIPFGQGFASMSAPSKELERLVLAGDLDHGGNPVLRWMAANSSVEMDAAGNIKPSKKKSTEKIDGIVSLVMALGRALVSEPVKVSIYETEGIKIL